MADLQQDRIGGGEPGPFRDEREEQHFDHVAVGYTNRTTLDDFIDGEAGDLVVRGPFHSGESVDELKTMGTGVTQGTPCLVVPLIHERMDQIQREVTAAIHAFQSRWEPQPDGDDERRAGDEIRAGKERHPGGHGSSERPHNFRQTGGTARGTSTGAIRRGSTG